MLFHEPTFLFVFLPATLALYLILHRYAQQEVIVWFLGAASIVFYGWWNWRLVPLLVLSILFNHFVGRTILARRQRGSRTGALTAFGVGANLCTLAVFKYLGFIGATLSTLLGKSVTLPIFDLPLGISFFTFVQIAFLADCHRGRAGLYNFGSYFLFVTLFPHLIAGPLVHHNSLIPQFDKKAQRVAENIAIGAIIFTIGLGKKLVLSTRMELWSDRVFDVAAQDVSLTFIEVWAAVLAFTFQIYFDFSAYSDMAIGLARMFGIQMPANFASPYKADSIIEFWRRWHMTLSHFLRDYLYIPLGGSQFGPLRRYVNLMIVMLLGGLWHGADWKFVIWGGLHGAALAVAHLWRTLRGGKGLHVWWGRFTTFLFVAVAWVPFRAANINVTFDLYRIMAGFEGVALPAQYADMFGGMIGYLRYIGVQFGAVSTFGGVYEVAVLGACLAFLWFMPNTQELLRDYRPTLGAIVPWVTGTLPLRVRLGNSLAVGIGLVFGYLVFLSLQGKAGEFIYFRF